MTRAKSHGRARTEMPRSRELRPVETAPDPSEGRAREGRFAPGNRISVRAGEKRAAKKLLGKPATDGDAATVARDAARAFRGAMRELPHDGQLPRSLAALYGRHLAASAFYAAKSDEAGPTTEDGLRFAELAMRHGARAERLAVTALDVATTLARSAPPKPIPWLVSGPEERGRDDDAPEDDVPAAADDGAQEPGGDTRVSPPQEQEDDRMFWRKPKPVEPEREADDASVQRQRERAIGQASWRISGPPRFDPRFPPPVGHAPAPLPPPARTVERAPDGPPAAPLPPGGVMRQLDDGRWSMAPAPSRARPSREAIEAMRAKGVAIPKHWEVDREG